MNRLYRPKSAVGEVLLSTYAKFGDNTDKQKWVALFNSDDYKKTRKQIADLVEWQVSGAKELLTAFDEIDKEANGTFFSDHPKLLRDFAIVQGAAQAAHDDWKHFVALEQFVEQGWKHVSNEYRHVKGLDPRRIDAKLHADLVPAEKDFLAAFSKPDYVAARKALPKFQKALWAILDSVELQAKAQEVLAQEYQVEHKRKAALEKKLTKILAGPRAQAYREFDKGELDKLMLRMRLAHAVAKDGVQLVSTDGGDRLAAWRQLIGQAEAGFKDFELKHPKPEKTEEPKIEVELDEQAFDLSKALTMIPDDVLRQYAQAKDAVLPKGGDGELARLKAEVERAYGKLDKSLATDSAPLLRQFDEAYRPFEAALKQVDAVNGPAAERAAERIAELASNGLLPVMNVEEKLALLKALRGSCAALASTTIPFKLTALGEAQADLLASLGVDEAFRQVDRVRRQKIAEKLVENEEDKQAYQKAQQGWIGMREEDRLALCRKVVQTQCGVLGIQACAVEIGDGGDGTSGWLDQSERKIFISNRQESAFHYSFEEVSNTLFHETSHWWQLLQVEALDRNEIPALVDGQPNPELLQIQLFALNHKGAHPSAYVSSGQGGAKYKKQPMEAHAYEVGDETQALFLKALLG